MSCFLRGQSPLQLHCTWGNSAVPKGQDSGSWTRGEVAGRNTLLKTPCCWLVQWAEKSGWGGSASMQLVPWRRSHVNSSRGCECNRYIFSVRKESAQSKGSCSCPRKMATECWWIQSRDVILGVQTSGTYLGPECHGKAWHYASLQTRLPHRHVKVFSLRRCKALLLQAQ